FGLRNPGVRDSQRREQQYLALAHSIAKRRPGRQFGYVSNFCPMKPLGPLVEPTQPLYLQYDMDRMHRPIQTGHPAWMHRDPPDFTNSLQIRASQYCFAIPACLSTELAVCRDRIFPSTGKRRCVIGLYQISWSPLPGRFEVTSMRTKSLPHARNVTNNQKVRMPISSCWYST